jgi:formylglycine-generating enzyme required for sulfatase activity
MTDTSSSEPQPDSSDTSTSNVSGGVAIDSEQVTIGGDVIGRDKIIQAGTYIEHATIIQAPQTPAIEEPLDPNARTWGGVEFIRIPAGSFLMGSPDDNALASDAEKPQHTVEIGYDYWIARYPVTNEQFARFIDAALRPIVLDKNWSSKADHPVVNINWREALEYCNWLQSIIGKDLPANVGRVRLPTEAEWEKAARGNLAPVADWGDTEGARKRDREWPWGNEFDKRNCNSEESGKKTTTSVGLYSPDGDSPYGLADMAGNVWEWTVSLWGLDLFHPQYRYPYQPQDGREKLDASSAIYRVVRGGAFNSRSSSVRCAYRYWYDPRARSDSVGFRVVIGPRLT